MTARELRILLAAENISRTELAKRLGASRQTVWNWCSERHPITAAHEIAIKAVVKQD